MAFFFFFNDLFVCLFVSSALINDWPTPNLRERRKGAGRIHEKYKINK